MEKVKQVIPNPVRLLNGVRNLLSLIPNFHFLFSIF